MHKALCNVILRIKKTMVRKRNFTLETIAGQNINFVRKLKTNVKAQ